VFCATAVKKLLLGLLLKRFLLLPDANDVAIEPMLSKKTLNALSKNIKK
jgi:hypothetical protein